MTFDSLLFWVCVEAETLKVADGAEEGCVEKLTEHYEVVFCRSS